MGQPHLPLPDDVDQLDEGPVILQDVFHINVGSDSLEDVMLKGLELEA